MGEGHAVLGEGAGLIGADDRGAAQRLHRRQPPDDGPPLRHPPHPDGKDHRDDGREALRNGGHRQGNGNHEDFHHRHPVQKPHHKDDGAGGEGQEAQGFPQPCQLLLKGGAALPLPAQKPRYLPHLGVHAGGGDHGLGAAIGDAAAGIDHIPPIPQGSILLHQGGVLLLRRKGFPCKGGFLHRQGGGAQKPGVGGDHIPRFQEDDIAGDQLCPFNELLPALPEHPGMGGGQPPEGVQGLFRLVLLEYSHQGVKHHDEEDEGRFKELRGIPLPQGGEKGDPCRQQQDENHGILKLVKESLEGGALFSLLQAVFPPPAAQLLRLGLGDPPPGHCQGPGPALRGFGCAGAS